jgi:micrococcal nuclease
MNFRQRLQALAVALSVAGVVACGSQGAAVPKGAATGPMPPADAFGATVDRVVDGDTFLARIDGSSRRLRVRIIGVDSPETVKPEEPAQCFGAQASAHLKKLVERRRVRAAYQPGGQRDRFGRELWDVWLPDGTFVAGQLVEQGYARTVRIRPQVRHAGYLRRLEERASRERRGLWAACPAQ